VAELLRGNEATVHTETSAIDRKKSSAHRQAEEEELGVSTPFCIPFCIDTTRRHRIDTKKSHRFVSTRRNRMDDEYPTFPSD